MRALRTCACMLLLLAAAVPAAAQRVRGAALTVDGAPVADVLVEIRRVGGETLSPLSTDSAGRFDLILPGPGRYELRASRLGLAPIGPAELIAELGQELEIVLRMSTEPLALDPVEVTARRAARTQMDEVRNRIEWVKRLGTGRALDRKEIEDRQAPTLPALIATMSPRVRTIAPVTGREDILIASSRNASGVCTPDMYLDGMRATGLVAHNLVTVENLEAVELYIGGLEAPAQYGGGSDCGVVLFWTRRGGDPGASQLTWRRLAVAGAIVAAILLVGIP